MDPYIVNREPITVLGVQDRLVEGMDEGVPDMWERRFMEFHDQIAALSLDGVYYGCAFETDQPEIFDYLAGMAVETSTEAAQGLTLREIAGGAYVRVDCTIATQDDARDLVENEWIPGSAYGLDNSRPDLDCYPPGSFTDASPMFLLFPVIERAE
jgi:predicted transcriptional regulator YdeE